MKIAIDSDKILENLKKYAVYLPAVLGALVLAAFIILTVFALFPAEDKEALAIGRDRVQELNIRFNSKLLGELSATKNPTTLGTAGGRDPFSGI